MPESSLDLSSDVLRRHLDRWLWLAACQDDLGLAKRLLRLGANPLAQTLLARRAQGLSLLGWALRNRDPQAALRLLPFFDPNELDPAGQDALMLALEYGNAKACLVLIPLCDLSRRDRVGISAMERAVFFEKRAPHVWGACPSQLIGARLLAQREERALRKVGRGAFGRQALRI